MDKKVKKYLNELDDDELVHLVTVTLRDYMPCELRFYLITEENLQRFFSNHLIDLLYYFDRGATNIRYDSYFNFDDGINTFDDEKLVKVLRNNIDEIADVIARKCPDINE